MLSLKLSLCWRNPEVSGTPPMLIDIAGTDSLPPWGLVGLLLPGKFMDLILDVVDLIEEQMLAILPLFFYIKDAQFILKIQQKFRRSNNLP